MGFALRVLVVLCGIGLVWWSMTDLVTSSGLFESGVRDVITWSPFKDLGTTPGDRYLTTHETSFYGNDFILGLQLALLTTFLGGLPLALLALAFRNTPMSMSRRPYLIGAFVFQFAAMVIALPPVGLWLMVFTSEPIGLEDLLWLGVFLAVGLSSALALPIWHRLRINATDEYGRFTSVIEGLRPGSFP
jgi:hypothetical protein